MKCFICDREDDLISYDKTYHEFTPCSVCQAIINETLEEWEDVDEIPTNN
jgi:cytidine deaminase